MTGKAINRKLKKMIKKSFLIILQLIKKIYIIKKINKFSHKKETANKMPKIMIVEDSALMRLTIKRILVNNNYEVIAELDNGNEVLAKYKELKPNLIILDLQIPGKSGQEVIKEIKSEDPKARIIVCTVEHHKEEIIKVLSMGVCAYILKPISENNFLEVIKKHIG